MPGLTICPFPGKSKLTCCHFNHLKRKAPFSVLVCLLLPFWVPKILLNNTPREKLNSVQEFVKIKSWLLLIFLTGLRSLIIKFYNSIKSRCLRKVINRVDRKWMASSSTDFTAKCEMVLTLTQENTSS